MDEGNQLLRNAIAVDNTENLLLYTVIGVVFLYVDVDQLGVR